jgi:hypothetical protein
LSAVWRSSSAEPDMVPTPSFTAALGLNALLMGSLYLASHFGTSASITSFLALRAFTHQREPCVSCHVRCVPCRVVVWKPHRLSL